MLTSCVSTGGYQASESETKMANAVMRNDTTLVKELLASGISPDSRMPVSGTPVLSTALSNNNLEIIKALIDSGAQVNYKGQNGITLLQTAYNAHG